MLPSYFNLEKRFYYNRLNPYEKALYGFWVESLLRGYRKLIYLPSEEYAPNAEESGYAPCFFYGAYGNDIDYCKVWSYMIYDCPELYFIYHYTLGVDRENHTLYFGGDTPDYSDGEIEEINAKLEEILHIFDGISDPFLLELAVHDYITKQYEFDFEGRAEIEKDGVVMDRRFYEKFTVVGLLKRGCAVCGGFIKLLQFVLQCRGFEVANILDIAGDYGRLHSWLAVKLDGKYYHLDLTFNEGSTLDLDYPQYKYFNITDEEIWQDHEFSYEKYPEILCNSTEFNYYHKMGLFFKTKEEITEAVDKHIKSMPSITSHSRFYFRTPKDLELKTVSYAIGNALKQNGMPMASTSFTDEDGYYALEINGDG